MQFSTSFCLRYAVYSILTEDCSDEAEDPAATPVFWISKWVDYSNKYGLGYELCDNSVGIVFNDNTKIALNATEE